MTIVLPVSPSGALPLLGLLSWCVCFQMGFWEEPAGVWLVTGPHIKCNSLVHFSALRLFAGERF